ncbi:putative Histidine kinase [Rubrivivax sp. A210]|uniref:ATP-binding protein n=1 Tax=Rubrivivax sp. A210 TaxID=2772301 RepID=UPI00191A70A8|nr:ATP-binding protein [Rubrivivax sp. A210]CAD5374368.1 putative Histidine kinase [Rubrivivax sp. A210]
MGRLASGWRAGLADPGAWRPIAATLLLNLALALVVVASMVQLRRINHESVAQIASNTASLLEANIAHTLSKADMALQFVVDAHPALQRHTAQERSQALSRIADRHGELNVLFTTDAQGLVQHWPPRPQQAALSVADRSYFARLRDDAAAGLMITPPLVGRTTGQPVVVLARRLADDQGRFEGIVAASISLRHFAADFEAMLREPGDMLTVRNVRGQPLVRFGSQGLVQADPAAEPAASSASGASPAAAGMQALLLGTDRVQGERRNATYGFALEVTMSAQEHRGRLQAETAAIMAGWLAFVGGSVVFAWRAWVQRARKRADEGALRDSESRFRSFFDHALIGMAVISPTREWLMVNPALAALLGRGQEALRNTSVLESVAPVFADAASGELGEIFAGRPGGAAVESRVARADGGAVDVLVSLRSFDGEGMAGCLSLCVQDISRRKASERQAAGALAMTQRFIDHFPGAAYLKDEGLRAVLVNRGFQTLLGLDPATVIGKTNAEIYPGEFGAKLDRDDREVLESGRSQVVEEPLGNSWYESHKFRVTGSDGRAMLGGLTLDVTLRHRVAERVAAMLELNALGGEMDEHDFVAQALQVGERLTHSRAGFLHYVDDTDEALELVTWTPGALPGLAAPPDRHCAIDQAGLWTQAWRSRGALVVNDADALSAAQAGCRVLPEGHAPLRRLACVPVVEDERVCMLMALGNAETDYDEFSVATLQLLGNDIWRQVRRRRADLALKQRVAELDALNQQLRAAQGQLLQSEKMASIGQLAAGVAHELNNPIGFVHSNLGTLAEYVQELLAVLDLCMRSARQHLGPAELRPLDEAWREHDLDYMRHDIVQLLAESRDGADRVRVIVKNLRDLAHVSSDELVWADLREGLDSTLSIVWNEIKYKANVVKEYGEIPPILCVPAQLNQVFMNLFVNAAQAIEQRGRITVRTGASDTEVWVEIADDGRGIAPEHLSRIFEPFFTTKPVGQGTGLGLSVSHSIVAKHRGRLTVCSEPGAGTTFRIALPRIATEAEAA